jgi:hypothetical protein
MVDRLDCEQVRELLDAYALGAAEAAEAKVIEEHVADCVRCWDELSSSQATAALLALSVRIEHPDPRLAHRIMSLAQRESKSRGQERVPFWRRLIVSPWPATAGAFAAISIAALVVTGLLHFQVQDVQDQNADLETQLRALSFNLQQNVQLASSQQAAQEEIFSILSDDSRKEVPVTARDAASGEAYYTWSSEKEKGFVICDGLPALSPGMVYQLWFVVGGVAYALQPFISSNGSCQVTLDLSFLQQRPDGIGITVEKAPGATRPTKPWLMYGDFSS